MDLEFCSECSDFKVLDDVTGWCRDCTMRHYPKHQYCENCGKGFDDDRQRRALCPRCRSAEWVVNNADKIELYIAAGLTYSLAVERVSFDNRPICLSCKRKVKGGIKGRTVFCTETAKCRTSARRYKYYKNNKGYNEAHALELVLQKLTGSTNE